MHACSPAEKESKYYIQLNKVVILVGRNSAGMNMYNILCTFGKT